MSARTLIESLRRPYGYWIDRSGNLTPVSDWGRHGEVAQDLLRSRYNEDVRGVTLASNTLQRHGYVRVAGVHGSREIYSDTSPPILWSRLGRYQQEALLQLAERTGQGLVFNDQPVETAVSAVAESHEAPWPDVGYRAYNYNPPRGASVADLLAYEEDELGNAGIRAEATQAAQQHGLDLARISARDAVWVTRTREEATAYAHSGDASDVKAYNIAGWIPLVDLGEEGGLLVKPPARVHESSGGVVAGKVFYHGARPGNAPFPTDQIRIPNDGAAYFSTDRDYAAGYADELFPEMANAENRPHKGQLHSAYLTIKNPKVFNIDDEKEFEAFTYHGFSRKELEAQGYDSVMGIFPAHDEFPEEIQVGIFKASQVTPIKVDDDIPPESARWPKKVSESRRILEANRELARQTFPEDQGKAADAWCQKQVAGYRQAYAAEGATIYDDHAGFGFRTDGGDFVKANWMWTGANLEGDILAVVEGSW